MHGVVARPEGTSYVMADIPGIIEGASDGAGLGHDFLRHIDRCRLLVHIVDVSGIEGRNPIDDFKKINEELFKYSPSLSTRPQIVAANKCDIASDKKLLEQFREYITSINLPFFEISAATHKNLIPLMNKISEELSKLPPIRIYEPEYVPSPVEPDTFEEPKIENYDDVWTIEAKWIQRLIQNTNFGDYESRMHFDRTLRQAGIYERLESLGIKEGDTVSIYNLEFEYRR